MAGITFTWQYADNGAWAIEKEAVIAANREEFVADERFYRATR